jgi:putative membrane protein
MKHLVLFATSLAALGLAGCGKKAGPAGEATSSADMSNAMASASESMAPSDEATAVATTPGQAFADIAATSDMFEIESSKLAATNAASAKIKSFAERMVKDHTASTAKLKAAGAKASPRITPVAGLTAAQQRTLTDLKTKSGADFDTTYAKAQVDAHTAALAELKAYAATGDVLSLRAFAGDIVPAVSMHLDMAKAL